MFYFAMTIFYEIYTHYIEMSVSFKNSDARINTKQLNIERNDVVCDIMYVRYVTIVITFIFPGTFVY